MIKTNNRVKGFHFQFILLSMVLFVASSCTNSKSYLEDKIQGMLLLGVYGDALGAPHEPAGLRWEVGDPERSERLLPFSEYEISNNPWGIWVPFSEELDNVIGIPTDDTSFRLTLLHPWMISVGNLEAANDAPFEAWMRSQLKSEFEPKSLVKNRNEQIRCWLDMYKDLDRFSMGEDQPSPLNYFYRKDIPVMFGMFMYLELAALSVGEDPKDVFKKYRQFCRLDEIYSGSVAGLLSAILSKAVMAKPSPLGFGVWFNQELDHLLQALGEEAHIQAIHQQVISARKIGVSYRGKSPKELLNAIADESFRSPLAELRSSKGYIVFDPLLVLKYMVATTTYESDGVKAVQLLAISPGDSDTIPSQLGSIVGAWKGKKNLERYGEDLKVDLERVSSVLSKYYSIDVQGRAKELSALVKP